MHAPAPLHSVLAFLALGSLATPVVAQVDGNTVDLLPALRARSIGPAGMSGRVAAVAVLHGRPETIWVGAASGGLWRSRNGGVTWDALFDDQPVASIGAIAVHPLRRSRVWVGTGEGNPRNSAASGNGLYLSDDGGESWQHVGLSESERIHRIVVHPRDPDTAWIGVLGKAWGPSSERGIYKTTDGGRSFRRVLYVDDTSGCADLVQHPREPNTLFAALWSFRRRPYDFVSGGAGSGLWRSHDGGETWTRLTAKDGLPKGELGRIGLAISHSQPATVYALVEAKKSALLRSDDGGRKFDVVNDSKDVAPRPFYFCDIRVDPADPNRVYRLASVIDVSENGGKSFSNLVPWSLVHPDHHALWIDPTNPDYMVNGNDGGIAISRDRGKTWRFVRNLPLAQYYHLAVDRERPYHVYGGMQDNGSWRGPSAVRENGGIRNHHWQELFFGDGFATIPDPDDSRTGYAMSQGGSLGRWNRITGERKTVRPIDPDGDPDAGPEGAKLRFNWNAAIAIDPFDAATVYYGSQFVHRSKDRGETWEITSPDLTSNTKAWQRQDESGGLSRDVTAAENYCSLLTIAPSAVQRGVIWTGSDDGRIHVTTDDGQTWARVDEAIPDLPANAWCAHIEASKFQAGIAWAVFDDHRRSDTRAWLFVTKDFGKTWRRLLKGQPEVTGPCLCLEQDPVEPSLLFLGTEFGLWFSRNSGETWTAFRGGLPTVAVRALIVHPDMHDLVIGTHGRAAWVVDDIRALRTMSTFEKDDFAVVTPRKTTQYRVAQTGASRFPASGEFRGTNRPYGVLLDVWVGERLAKAIEERKQKSGEDSAASKVPFAPAPDEIELEIYRIDADAGDRRVRTVRSKVVRGLNRVVWNLRSDAVRPAMGEEPGAGRGPEVLPGRYEIRARLGESKASTNVDVLPDPRVPVSDADRRRKWQALRQANELRAAAATAIERIEIAKRDLTAIRARLADLRKRNSHAARTGQTAADDARFVADEKLCEEIESQIDAVEILFRPKTDDIQGIAPRDGLLSRIYGLSSRLRSSWDAPSPDHARLYQRVRAELEPALEAWNRFEAGPLVAFRDAIVPRLGWFQSREPLRIR